MKNFLISACVDVFLILLSYFLFVKIISGPTRHKLYEKFFKSFAKFIIYLFFITLAITGLSALILYRTAYIAYINIISPALVSILVGFLMSTVPTRGEGDNSNMTVK
ncbi:hypothetical protein [Clostridium luticellarii]|uniref:Uncharacterized protein n=1 Tax=Clostridium luticellarii TaxID=1691940 RepID=A0A2T0BP64_9CLOT|nr:hypothetical protein [Clostridium luticellarii]MCI1944608.1 hypothetical protein [Clostridium luticellarii]MCI1968107.1 hypothetical protein [Clostridium luticellarii]MCI1994780.1 hypothetical protein [Clostridium luticellarii]MCI2039012.1 hypothetical protein [Clostridium luticellarii]PRR85612.1 hypothetical protein CLLU_13660 [Clostridium luticellarii]